MASENVKPIILNPCLLIYFYKRHKVFVFIIRNNLTNVTELLQFYDKPDSQCLPYLALQS